MKKTFIAAAIAAAIAAPAANAGVTIYGKIHASIDYLDGPHSGDEAWYVASRASRIGFKGAEDLGNGLSVIWKAETGYDIADGAAWSGARNAYIGLAGDWGTFLYGRHDTPMKISTGSLDLFGDQLGDYNWAGGPNNALLGPGFGDVRASNAIAYISPNMNGLTIAGAIIPGEGTSGYGSTNDGLADSYSVAAMYNNNGLTLAAAYEVLAEGSLTGSTIRALSPALTPVHGIANDTITDSDEVKKWRVGVGYTMNALTLNAVYENQEADITGAFTVTNDQYEADIWQVSAAYDIGNSRLKLAYGQNDAQTIDGAVKTEGESTHWAVGLDHSLSKRTKVYAVYADASLDDVTVTGNPDVDGADYSGFSLGMMHSF